MSEVVGEGVIHIRSDDSGVDVAAAGSKAGKGYTRGFLGSLKGLAVGIGSVIAAREVIGFAKDALAEGREAQKVAATSEQIIKSTGQSANVTANQLGELTAALSARVGVDDEAIQTGSNLLLTFKNVRNEVGEGNNIFARANESMLDLSAAGFGSIDSAAKGLGKALNDPLKGITALGRAGVTFTESQKAQIKAMVESGDLLGAQKIILEEIESQVGGVAEATATSSAKAQVAWGNLQEQVGSALIPVIDDLAETFAGDIVPALSGMIDGSNTAGRVIRDVAAGIGDAIGFVQDALSSDEAGGFLDQIVATAQAGLPIVVGVLGELLGAGREFAQDVLPVMADTFQNVVLPAILGLVSYAQENLLPLLLDVAGIIINDVVPTLAAIATLIYGTVYPAIVQIVAAVAENLKPVFDQLVETFRRDVLPTVQSLVQTIRNDLLPAVQPVVEKVLGIVGAVLKLAAAILGKVLPPVIQFAGFLIRNLVPILAQIIVKVVEFVGGVLRVGQAIGGAIADIGRFIGRLAALYAEYVNGVLSLPGKIIDMVQDMYRAGKRFIGGLLDGILEAASGVGGVVSDIASSVRDAIVEVVNEAIDLINSGIPNSIGTGPLTIDLPNNPIPHLARGTSNWPGGWSWVGEEGPELVNLRRGAQVIPAPQSAALAQAVTSGGRGGVTVMIDKMMPHNYGEFERQVLDRARVAALGSRRPIVAGMT